MPVPNSEIRLEAYENDNQRSPHATFWKNPGPGHAYSGNLPDLDDAEIEWNDKMKSCVLHGPAGTTVWLYDSKGFKDNDDVLEIKVPNGAESVIVNNFRDGFPNGVSWIKKKNRIAGKVSGIQWK
jgi:hypothetical protein